VYENEGHGFVRRENEIDSIKRAATFLDTNLGQRLKNPTPSVP
jgi:dipeptidyl aminopeptidase/acylaminoacyl peptidase